MSVLTWLDQSQPMNMFGLSFAGFSSITNTTTTSFRWNSVDGSFFEIAGSGFTYDGSNHPTGGTISSIDAKSAASQPVFSITGMALSASQLASWVASNDTYNFLTTTLAGNDTITGGAQNDQINGFAGNDTI